MWDKLEEIPILKKGGIHIKKKNRGKFTESANRAGMGVQEFANHVLANKDKYSPILVKRANFARNSKKFKHENGGILKAQGGTRNLFSIKPGSPLDQAWQTANEKLKYPGVKQIVGPDGNKVAIRSEESLKPVYISEYLPGTGDLAEAGYIADDVKNGNYRTAVLASGLMVLPGNSRKILDKFGINLGDTKTLSKLSDKQWDDMYFEAIDLGDMDLVQSIRDAHFKVKAPDTKAVNSSGDPIRVFHGEKDFPEYHDLRYLSKGPDRAGLGVYYSSSNKDIAETYAQFKGNGSGKVRSVYYNLENPRILDAEGRNFTTVEIVTNKDGIKTGKSTDKVVNDTYWEKSSEGFMKKSNNDGVIINNVIDHAPNWKGSDADAIASNYITWNPTAVKSADAIVKNPRTGEIIPISKRDNFSIPSILMGSAPAILSLGAIKSVYNTTTNNQE